jgi:LuxR family maltose regulon positive regulatory protein
LEKAVRCPVVNLVAGAGYGKTLAVYSFLQGRGAYITAWLQLSEMDNRESRFWKTHCDAIGRQCEKELGAKLKALGFPGTHTRFENYLHLPDNAMQPVEKYIFVYDNLHLIHNKAVLKFIERSINTPYQNVSTIFISRTEPPVDTMTLLSKGLVARITEDELRFSPNEIAEYFFLNSIRVSSRDLSDVYEDTQGWPLAVHFAAKALRDPLLGRNYARSLMKSRIFELIEKEIFADLGDKRKKFLIRMSLVDHLPQDIVLKIDPGYAGDLAGLTSFISFDSFSTMYKMHPLLREYLGRRQGELTEEEKNRTYELAAGWCAANGQIPDALRYYKEAGNYEAIVRLALSMPQTTTSERAKFILSLMDGVPPEIYEKYPFAHIIHARLAHIADRSDEAQEELDALIKKFEALPSSPETDRVLVSSYIERGFFGNFRCMETRDYGFAKYFKKAYQLYCRHPSESPLSFSHCVQGPYLCKVSFPQKGEPEKYLNAVSAAAPLAARMLGGYTYGVERCLEAEILYFRGELDAAEEALHETLHKAREKERYALEAFALFYLLMISLAQGDAAAVSNIRKQLDSLSDRQDYPHLHLMREISIGWFFCRIGQTEEIAPWLKNDFVEDEAGFLLAGMQPLIRAYHQFDKKKYHAALATLTNTEKKNGLHSFLFGKITLKSREAMCRYFLHDKKGCFAALKDARDLAAPNGLDMPFIEMGKDMRAIAGTALGEKDCGIERAWLERILNKSSAYAKKIFPIAQAYQKASKIQEQHSGLSPREIDMLKSLGLGMTREEMADQFYLSVNTIKSTLKSLYRKLGAANRVEALRIASSEEIL